MANNNTSSISHAYAIKDVRSHEHDVYKASQYNYRDASQRLRDGDEDSPSVRLELAREAREWALESVHW